MVGTLGAETSLPLLGFSLETFHTDLGSHTASPGPAGISYTPRLVLTHRYRSLLTVHSESFLAAMLSKLVWERMYVGSA